MKNYFEYKVEVWEDGDMATYRGVTYGDTYHEALNNILDFFGNSNVISLKMEEWDAEGCLIMSKEVIDELKKTLYQ